MGADEWDLVRVLVAIPCFNEEVAIGSVVLKAKRHAAEVLVVDDGSSDKTVEVARLAGATVLKHDKNGGKGKAYQTLWEHARKGGFDALAVLDGDGQHDADEIPLLLAQLAAGSDLVIGARWGERTQMPLWRKAGKRVLDYATAAGSEGKGGTGPKVTDSQSGFRAFDRKALDAIAPKAGGFSIESQMLMDAHEAGLAIGEVPIHCRYDVDGSTEAPLKHATKVLNDILVAIGVRHPLLYLALPGTLAILVGGLLGAWVVWVYKRTHEFAIGTALVTVLLVVVGVLGVFAGLVFNVLPRLVRKEA
jgi:glycosyltransferase involved in cell wall biosynthesis